MEIRLNPYPKPGGGEDGCRCVVVLCPYVVARWTAYDGWRMERDTDWPVSMRWRVISASWPRVGPEALEAFA